MTELSIHSDEHYMRLALQQAQLSFENSEIPVGAVIIANHKVIAKAHNQVQQLNDVTAHAEMVAITSAQNHLGAKYLDQCTLYVTLEPCTMCAGALYWSQIGRIVIAAKDEKRGYQRLEPSVLHPKTEVSYGVLEDAASGLLSDFFTQMRLKTKRKN
ncbi:MAG: tRNA(adenine34) deaminase [Cyclobacteriaceae bacterium]|jgi:tRNA(adenine34) deaminase